jgi:DNA-binding NarL/FixJ family response regulator
MNTNGLNGTHASLEPRDKVGDNVKLTRREVEVLTKVIEGKSSKEVAEELYVSKRTVDFHLANIYEKLRVNNRVQAFREASRRGLIAIDVSENFA